jgi:hypothetical protein
MATLGRTIHVVAAGAAAGVALAGCGDLHGLAVEDLPPLASIHVRVTGDLDAVRTDPSEPAHLRVKIMWTQPWLPDASCLPPFENAQHEQVANAGCGDLLGIRRASFGAAEDGAAVAPDGTATLDLLKLPDLLFGDMYSQLAYATLIVYDDHNNDGALEETTEVVYGASFSTMSKPDTRVAFRHGGFDDQAAYYPRRGCAPPPEGFSLVSAGGFTLDAAMAAQARGELPAQDPAQCRQDSIDHEVTIALQRPEELDEVSCYPFGNQFQSPLLGLDPRGGGDSFVTACTSIPDRGTGRAHGRYQLLSAAPSSRGCKHITHYILRGCFSDPLCEQPEWNDPPPSWWPCPAEAP